MSLVVNQTPDVQEQVEGLLAALRRLQDEEVAVELRFVSLPVRSFDRVVADLPGDPRQQPVPLDDARVRRFLEAVQQDPEASVMQAPKMTLFNGQCAALRLMDEQKFVTGVESVRDSEGRETHRPRTETIATGLQMSLQPAIAADRRSVQLDLSVRKTDVNAPFPKIGVDFQRQPRGGSEPVVFTQYVQQPQVTTYFIKKRLKVAAGGTVVLKGWTEKGEERRVEYGPPALRDIPFLGRLFTNVGYGSEPRQVVLLVTPRVIVPPEVEQVKGPVSSCPRAAVIQAHATSRPAPGACAEQVAPCRCSDSSSKANECCRHTRVAELVRRYQEACARGATSEAVRLAVQALALDPACFHQAGRENAR